MANYEVTFEGETSSTDDDKTIIFNEMQTEISVPDDFMPKMFEYLEGDEPYQVLYQIKAISKDKKILDSKNFVSIIAEYNAESKGGLLLEDKEGFLKIIGTWNTNSVDTLLHDIYDKPDLFELVVVTISESIAPE